MIYKKIDLLINTFNILEKGINNVCLSDFRFI